MAGVVSSRIMAGSDHHQWHHRWRHHN